jgi:WD40 repeat protein
MTDVFISYSRVDKPFVRRLHAALQGAGRGAWVDWEGIPPSAEWLAEIYGAIEAADAFVFVITTHSVASAVCRQEIDHAAIQKKRLVPVLAEDVATEAIPEVLRRLNWVDMRGDAFDAGFGLLIAALDTDLAWVKDHTRVLVRAAEWNAKDRDRSLLLRGKDLQAAERWFEESARHPSPEPTPLQAEFIVASRHADARRQRLTLIATLAALVVSSSLAVWAYWERGVAQRQTQLSVANNLLVESQSDRHAGSAGAQLRILLGVQSLQRLSSQGRSTLEALRAVDAAASLRARRIGSAPRDGDANAVALSADGTRLVSWNGARLTLRYTSGMQDARSLPARDRVTIAALNQAGTLLAVGDPRGAWLQGIDDTAASATPLPGCDGRMVLLRFDRTGAHVGAIADAKDGNSGLLCVWSAATHTPLVRESFPSVGEARVAKSIMTFSGDGTLVAARVPAPGEGWRILLFDVNSGMQRRSWNLNSRSARIAFRGRSLVVAEDVAIWTWSASGDREESRWKLDDKWRPLELSPDGRFVTIGLFSGRSWVMDDFSYQLMGLFDSASGVQLAEMPAESHTFSQDEQYLIQPGAASYVFAQLPSMRTARFVPESGRLLVNQDSTIAVTVSDTSGLTAWSLADAPQVWSAPSRTNLPDAWTLSPDGSMLAAASSRDLQIVDLLDASRTRHLPSPILQTGLAFSRDGRYLAGVGGDRLALWDARDFTRRRDLKLAEAIRPAEPCALLDRECRQQSDEQALRQHTAPLLFGSNSAFAAWAGSNSLQVWSLPEGKPVFSESAPIVRDALLEVGDRLLIGRADGTVAVVETTQWQRRQPVRVHSSAIHRLTPMDGGASIAALSTKEVRSYGIAHPKSSEWSVSVFSPDTGDVTSTQAGRGIVGPWSVDGRRFTVRTDNDAIDIIGTTDEARVRVKIHLRPNVSQAARALGFTADGRFLLVESETPVTLGRSEPTLHVVDTTSGREITRMPVRADREDTIKLDRAAPYPERFVARGASNLVASLIFENADQYWGVSAGRAKKDLVAWRISNDGALEPVFRRTLGEDIKPVDLDARGGVLVTLPMAPPQPGVPPTVGLQVWAIDLERRIHRACAATGSDLTAQQWKQFIGDYTGEEQRPTCAPTLRPAAR